MSLRLNNVKLICPKKVEFKDWQGRDTIITNRSKIYIAIDSFSPNSFEGNIEMWAGGKYCGWNVEDL